MVLRSTKYRVTFCSKNGRLYCSLPRTPVADARSQGSTVGKATAEQVLNDILPGLAETEPGMGLKPGAEPAIQYTRDSSP
jgi:hypothetical protein